MPRLRIKRAIALRPDSWEGYNRYGDFLDDHQRYEESISQFRHAIELTPDNASLYSNLGSVYIDLGDPKRYPEAEKTLQKSIALEPSYPAYTNLGYLYIQEKKYAEASQSVEKALQINDKDYFTWGNLAIAYTGLDQNEKASQAHDREIGILEKSAQLTPRDAIVQSTLGLLYAQKKLREKAISRIQSALALSPDDPQVLEAAGQAYEDLGDRVRPYSSSRKACRKAILSQP